jgi:hypothetical protein
LISNPHYLPLSSPVYLRMLKFPAPFEHLLTKVLAVYRMNMTCYGIN